MAERLRVPLPVIVMNCSYRFDPPVPPERRFHDALGLDAGRPGSCSTTAACSRTGASSSSWTRSATSPSAVLVLMGYGVLEPSSERRAADPAAAGRIRVLPAVPPDELLAWVACADVVAMPIQPSTLNHRLTTPNKLFEAMAAGVPVVASDLPGMATIVRDTGCGLLCDPADPASIAPRSADDPGRARGGAAGATAGAAWTPRTPSTAGSARRASCSRSTAA